METAKVCSKCERLKDLKDFSKAKNGRFGVRSACKVCTRKDNIIYEKNNKALIAQKQVGKHLRLAYGLSVDQLEAMKVAQNYKCAICDLVKPLVVDHCHKSTKVRGLLCKTCNIGIGLLQENPEVMRKAAIYILQENT